MLPLDTVHAFETPEGVDLRLRVAGPLPRALAFVLDALIRYALLFVLSMVLLPLAGLGVGAFLLLLFALEWFYPVLFEVARGATPGKKAMGLTVVHDNGTPVGWPAALIRNLLRVVDFLPLLYGIGLLSMLINRRFQRLGDLAAGTLVVYLEPVRQAQVTAIDAEARALPAPLAVEEQRALLDFAARRASLAPGRVEELAEILCDERGPAAVQTVLGYARWLEHGR